MVATPLCEPLKVSPPFALPVWARCYICKHFMQLGHLPVTFCLHGHESGRFERTL
jgi:hypothetical protein